MVAWELGDFVRVVHECPVQRLRESSDADAAADRSSEDIMTVGLCIGLSLSRAAKCQLQLPFDHVHAFRLSAIKWFL